MKKLFFLLIFSTLLLNVQASFGQLSSVVPKPELMNTLEDVSDLNFDKGKNDALKKHNESFVNDIYDIVDGEKSEEDKKFALKDLKKKNEKGLSDLLGEDGYKKYKKKMKKQLRPYKRKMNLLKFVL